MGGSHWKPIGEKILSADFSAEQPTTTANCTYAGVFDGAGHAVTNFTVASKDAVVVYAFPDQHVIYTAAALFGIADSGATVKNLTVSADVTNESYKAGANNIIVFTGGIIGYNSGTVANCTNSGTVTPDGQYSMAGGISGFNDGGTITNCGFLAGAALPAIGTGKTAYPEVVAVVSLDITAYNQTAVAAALSDDIAGTAITMETGESFVVKTKLLPGTNIASPENYYKITSANVTDDVASAAITATDVTVKALTAGSSQLTLKLKLKATDFEKAAAGSFEPISGNALEVTFTAPITVTSPTAGSSCCNAGIPALALLFLASFALMHRKC